VNQIREHEIPSVNDLTKVRVDPALKHWAVEDARVELAALGAGVDAGRESGEEIEIERPPREIP
jgi:hypothetical protein